MANKYALFIVGKRSSGKSTLIRSLTGSWKNRVWNVKKLNGQPLKAFVSHNAPQEMTMSNYPPQNFPESIEDKYGVRRNDYDILISALELVVRDQASYGYQRYIQTTQNKGFDVRIAALKTAWNNAFAGSNEITTIQNFAQQNNIPLILVNASNDPNAESFKIRQTLYP